MTNDNINFLTCQRRAKVTLPFAPDPTWVAYSAPPGPLAGFKGPTSKERERREREWRGRREGEGQTSKGREGAGKGREGKGGKGRGGKGKGKGK